jgi:hypothetical protein
MVSSAVFSTVLSDATVEQTGHKFVCVCGLSLGAFATGILPYSSVIFYMKSPMDTWYIYIHIYIYILGKSVYTVERSVGREEL